MVFEIFFEPGARFIRVYLQYFLELSDIFVRKSVIFGKIISLDEIFYFTFEQYFFQHNGHVVFSDIT